MFERFTRKQKKFINDIINKNTKRINILEGSVRSGKTYVSLIAWVILLCQYEKSSNFLMVGKTITSLKRNCLCILEELLPSESFSYSITKKEAVLFGRRVFLEGVNDSRSEHKIRGMTLQGAYCDEITLFTEDFFAMLLSRLSLPGAKLLGTTNPDTPTHWLMKKYLKRKDELNLKVWKFLLDDNDTIPKETRDDMKREYTGVFYDRFILGKWVQAEGLIYNEFANNKDKYIIDDIRLRDLTLVYIGIDYGASKSKTAMSAVGFVNGYKELVVLDEFLKEGILTPEQMYVSVETFYNQVRKKYGWIAGCYADWGGLGQVLTKGLRTYCHRRLEGAIINDCSKCRIIERIQILNRMIGAGKFKIMRSCHETIEALDAAVWDPDDDDTRLDDGTTNIDILDAMEYGFGTKIGLMRAVLDAGKKKLRGLPII